MTKPNSRSAAWRGLAAAAAIAALSLTACTPEAAPPFELTGEGAIEGMLFFDTDRDDRFDPAGGDVALEGVELEVRERGTQRVFSGGHVTTGADGRFEVTGLPPGTHDLWIDEETLPEGVVVCRNPTPVSVYRGEPAAAVISALDACLITIAEALDEGIGTFVNIRGIAVSQPGNHRTDNFYIEDATGGVQVFQASGRDAVEIGDRVTITGDVGMFNDELQIVNGQVDEVEKAFADPEPHELTTAEARAQGAPETARYQGTLVRITAARMMSGFENWNAPFDDSPDEDGTSVEVRIEAGAGGQSDIDENFEVGSCYDITGILGTFRGTAQIKPRSFADVEEVACP